MKDLEKLILAANFEEARKIVSKEDFNSFSDEMLSIAYQNESIANYSFLNYLLIREETNNLHDLAFSLLVNPLCHLEGAYNSALYHARRSVELTEGQNVGSLENLLFLNNVPEELVSDQEVIEICRKLLSLDESNQVANDTLKELS